MARERHSWWSGRFIAALEEAIDRGRLQRGRGYASPRRILAYGHDKGRVRATVRGNRNPYYGVFDEPEYDVSIALAPIPSKAWQAIIAHLGTNAAWLSRLLMGEVPRNIETAFTAAGHHLLPASPRDIDSHCSCPDHANPCKHVAGVLFHLAAELDHDPFVLFELRGLPRDSLRQTLADTPLGRALADQLAAEADLRPEPRSGRYPEPAALPPEPDLSFRSFWEGGTLPEVPAAAPPPVPALLIRKQGDNPPFWDKDGSFIEAMTEIYETVWKKRGEEL